MNGKGLFTYFSGNSAHHLGCIKTCKVFDFK